MLNEIRRLFRRSLDAFRAEVNTREPQDQVAELLAAMRRELVAAKATIAEHENDLARAAAELERERDALAQCERRGVMADRIADHETARVAREFAARHREKAGLLEKRVEVATAELALRRREADEMRLKYQEADANRFVLIARLRHARTSSQADSPLSTDDELFEDLDRMAERVGRDAATVDALEELEDHPPRAEGAPDSGVEERLHELKRQMGRET